MAKQKGVIKYNGTIGDIRHFRIKGRKEYFAGLKGGPTANQIKNAPEFARTRENMAEFGGSANAAKALRGIFGPALSRFADSSLTGRWTAVMRGVLEKDLNGERGKRNIKLTQNREILSSLIFNKKRSIESYFSVLPSVDYGMDSTTFTFPQLNGEDHIKAPAKATDFRIVFIAGLVSDYQFNAEINAYEPVNANDNGRNYIHYSEIQSLQGALNLDFEVTANDVGFDISEGGANSVVIHALGIEFYRDYNGTKHLINGANGLKIFNAS